MRKLKLTPEICLKCLSNVLDCCQKSSQWTFSLTLFLAVTTFLRGSCVVQEFPSDAVVTYGTTHALTCRLGEGDSGFWNEVPDGGGTPFLLFAGDSKFETDEKYNNFEIVGELPNYNMRITSAAIDDEGTYECATSRDDAHNATFKVEVPPLDVIISCSSSTNCPADEEDFSSEVICICTAIGAYPGSLQLEWTDASPINSEAATIPSNTGPQGSLDFTHNAVPNVTGDTGIVQCTLTGYVNNIAETTRKASYQFSSPACSLRALPDTTTCETADFNCSCENDMPKVSEWSLFSQNMTKIGDSDDGIFEDVDISANKTSMFYCRGCNGIYGGSLASTPVTCELATTTPTMAVMTTSTPVKGQGLPLYGIILIVLVCVGVACGTGIAVYCFCCPTSDQESVKRSNNDNTDGNGVNSKLQSEPDQVEYAAVNKPKSDPQPAPRSSKPPGNNTEPEKVELQYADIDHSNRGRSNEIHQPADAPTEYATVQSVIV